MFAGIFISSIHHRTIIWIAVKWNKVMTIKDQTRCRAAREINLVVVALIILPQNMQSCTKVFGGCAFSYHTSAGRDSVAVNSS